MSSNNAYIYVDLALPIAIDQLFTYKVPPELLNHIKIGVRAVAPFGKKTITGFIVNIKDKSDIANLKFISDILETEPLLSDEMIKLTKWISEYYFSPWGETLKAVLPQSSLIESKKILSIKKENLTSEIEKLPMTPTQHQILKIVSDKQQITLSQIQKLIGKRNLYNSINELSRKNLISIDESFIFKKAKPKYEYIIQIDENNKISWENFIKENQNKKRLTKQIAILKHLLNLPDGTIINIKTLLTQTKTTNLPLKKLCEINLLQVKQQELPASIKYELNSEIKQFTLTSQQLDALVQIKNFIDKNEFQTFLLHGITSSGKTQIYIEAIRYCLSLGKTAIVLVPEISLTPQTVSRFQAHFGDKVTVIHSKLSLNERFNVWRQTHQGKFQIIIGPRSAVFTPLKNIGLIVVDEEHENSYKQFDQTPKYHARDVAIVRASINKAVVILGSATPSIESYYNALNGKYKLIELLERVDNAKLPEVQIVDMRKERERLIIKFKEERKLEFKKDPILARQSKRRLEYSALSEILKEKIQDRLNKKEGIILLQNRRGFSSFLECFECGYVEMCENCHVSLTYHIVKKHLRCHYCGYVKNPPGICPECNSTELSYKGYGTQRVEEELIKIFPEAIITRMDLDTTSKKRAHDKILTKFAKGEIDILLGTQMVAKGLDFSHVTLVGVISADIQMLLPDFRSAERTFQLLTQVAGRAGRSGLLKGEVIIQTFQPENFTLKHVITHNYTGFYKEEINERYNLKYPPFSRIALIEIKGENESAVIRTANKFYEILIQEKRNLIILGPSEAAISRLKKNYRWHILIKDPKNTDPTGKILHEVLANGMNKFSKTEFYKSQKVKISIDVDPVSMM